MAKKEQQAGVRAEIIGELKRSAIPKTAINVRLSRDVVEEIEALMKETGADKTAVVEILVRRGLELVRAERQ